MDIQLPLVSQNRSEVLCLLDITLAPVFLAANVADLLVNLISEISSSELKVILVVVFFLELAVVLMLLGNLKDHVCLLLLVFVVWIHKHVLVVVGDIVELAYFLIFMWLYVQNYILPLNQEMRVSMFQEWVENLHIILPLVITGSSVRCPSALGHVLRELVVVVAEAAVFVLVSDAFRIKRGVSPCRDSFSFQLVVSSAVIQILVYQ